MSTSIEQRVVQMRFDNKQFEAGVSQTMTTLDKFKAKLDFRGATKGLDDINKAAAKVSLQPITNQVDKVSVKFDALAVVAATALSRITNAAITTGKNMVKALTLDPVTTGFSEYETKLNSIQTIMSNTASKGTTMEDVTRVIDELNTYADKTIYNFAEMTRNIGTFTAAGVGLEEAAKAIQGIANLAAVSGSNSQQASVAMYQLSQALASGTVKLMDWNSVVNAGMGGQKFQDALKRTAREHGIAIDDIIKKQGSFRESLSQGWLSADILNETLHKFTVKGAKEYAEAMMESGKYTQEQADALIEEAQAMEDAATKVKTFTQLWDTLRESAQSGWGQTWEIVIGDFEKAKELFTSINDVLSGFINASSDARNAALKYWKELGGRVELIEAGKAAFQALVRPLTAVKTAIDDILFPGTTNEKGTWLYNMTVALKEFAQSLVLSDEAVATLRVSVKLLLLPIQILIQVIRVGVTAVTGLIKVIFRLVDAFLALPSKIGPVSDLFKKIFGNERYERFAAALAKATSNLGDAFGRIGDRAKELALSAKAMLTNGEGILGVFNRIGDSLKSLVNGLIDRVIEGLEAFGNIDFSKIGVVEGITSIGNAVRSVSKTIKKAKDPVAAFLSQFKLMSPVDILNTISQGIQKVLTNVKDFFKNVNIQPAIDGLIDRFGAFGDVIRNVVKAIVEFVDRLTPAKILVFSFGATLVIMLMNLSRTLAALSKIISTAKKTFDAVTGLLSAITQKIKGNKIVQVALSLTALALALKFLSTADPEGLKQATISILSLMAAITGMTALLGVINKFLVNTPELTKNLQMIGVAMLAMAGSVAVLSGALWVLSKVDMEGMGIKLIALVLMMGVMAVAVDQLGHYSGDALGKAAIILSFASAMLLITRAIVAISKENVSLSFNTVVALLSIVAMLKFLANQVRGVRFSGGAGMVLLVLSLELFAKSLKKLSKYDPATLLSGLINFIPIFITLKLLSNVIGGAKETAKMGTQILAISVSMLILQKAIEKLGNMDLAVVVKGGIVVTAMIGVFGVIQRLSNMGLRSGKIQGSFIKMAAAILILSLAISYIGSLDLKTVAQGTIVVSALMIFLTLLAKAVGEAQKATAAIVTITICLGMLIAAMALLTLLDPKELGVSVGALSVVMLSLGAMFKLIGEIKIETAVSTIVVMTALLAELGYAFKQLNDLDSERMLATATALSEVMIALGVTAKLFKTIDVEWGDLGKTALALVAMLAAAGIVVWRLNEMPIQEGLIEKASALSLVIVALGGVATLMSKFNAGFVSSASAGGGIAAFMGILALTLTLLGGLFSLKIGEYTLTSFLETGINTINSMYKIIPAITVIGLVAGVFSKFNIDVAACAQASFGIGIFMTVLTAFVTLIGAFFQQFPNLEADLDMAVQVFPKIGAALGGLIGGFGGGLLSGLAGGVMESLNSVAVGFSNFIENMKPFFDGLSAIDASKVTAVSSLGTMILALTAADMVNSIGPFVINNPLAKLGAQLTEFGPKFAEFATSISGIDVWAVRACALSLQAFADVIGAVPQDVDFLGIFSKTTNFEGFGEGMKSFAEAFKKFAEVVDTSTLSEETVNRTRYAMEALTDMANNIPSSGGKLEVFFGKKDIADFGTQMQSFATNLMGFFKIVSDGNIDTGLVEKCANAGKALADFASNIPSTGGKLQIITGIKDMSLFGNQLIGYAVGLVGFFNTLNGTNSEAGPVKIDKGLVDKAAYAGSAFAELAKQLPGTGGIWQRFVGSVDLGTFGTDIRLFGQGLYDFFYMFNSLKITDEQVEIAKNAGMAFSELVNNIKPNEGAVTLFKKVNLEMYGTDLSALGEGMKAFYTAISTVNFDTVATAVESIKSIIGLQADMENLTANGAVNFGSYLTALASVGLGNFATTFANGEDQLRADIETTLTSALQTAANNIGTDDIDITNIMSAIIAAFVNKRTVISDLAGDVVSWFKEAFDAKRDVIESCGATIIDSLYNGANNKFTEYVTNFEQLANSIVSTFSEAFNIIGSISLEFQSIGKYCISGFMKGFESEASLSASRIRTVANNIATTTEDALGVASPSVRFAEIGMYCMQGLANGIGDNAKYAINKAVKMGANLLESVKQFFGIKSPSTVMRDEVGRYIVEGIADGITNNTSAEEAATKKAQNIVNAFKTEFDKLDQVLNTKNLEYELWQAMNPNATAGEANLKQAEMLDAQMKIQAERVNAANAQYQATLKSLGATASQTSEAYDTYLQEKINMADMAAQLTELQNNNTEAFKKFAEVFAFNMENLSDMGFTREEIERVSKEQTGWFDPKTIGKTGSIEDIMNQYLNETTAGTADVEVVIKESVQRAVSQASATAKQGGKQIIQSVNEGVEEASNESAEGGAFGKMKEIIESNLPGEEDGKTSGSNLISGIEQGINNASSGITSIGGSISNAAGGILDAFNNFLGEHSPSIYTEESGKNLMIGLANGIMDPMANSQVHNSIQQVSNNTISVFDSVPSDYTNVGLSMMEGLTNGINSGASKAIDAAVQVAKKALAKAEEALGIRSPSREFYRIGKMIDQGLSNGILDDYSIVDGSISKLVNRVQQSEDDFVIRAVVDMDELDEAEERIYTLEWDLAGNLVPAGYSNTSKGGKWLTVDEASYKAIRSLYNTGTAGWGRKDSLTDHQRRTLDLIEKYANEGYAIDAESRRDNEGRGVFTSTNYNFTQNITSPAGLNAVEIARRANNAMGNLINRANAIIHQAANASSFNKNNK